MDVQQIRHPGKARHAARVSIKTLGFFTVTVAGAAAIWKGFGPGVQQQRRMLAYCVAHCGELVHREDLWDIAGGRTIKQRPNYVVSGFRTMLKCWGMHVALKEQGMYLGLYPDANWHTDTDDLLACLDDVGELNHTSAPLEAIAVLNEAAQHCDGVYLPDVDLPAAFDLSDKVEYWNRMQKQVLQLLTRLSLTTQERTLYRRALWAAERALRMGDIQAVDYDLVAEAAHRCGLETLVAAYQEKARRLRSKR